MNNTMEYKGYIGSVEFSETDQILYGKVQGIRSLISYEGVTVSELINDFRGAVDDYISLCAAEGKTPEKAFKGSFNVRFKILICTERLRYLPAITAKVLIML